MPNSKMSSWQNIKLAKCQVDKRSTWQNVKLAKCQVDEMTSWQNVNVTKCQVEKMSIWQNAKLTKCQVDEMTQHLYSSNFKKNESVSTVLEENGRIMAVPIPGRGWHVYFWPKKLVNTKRGSLFIRIVLSSGSFGARLLFKVYFYLFFIFLKFF